MIKTHVKNQKKVIKPGVTIAIMVILLIVLILVAGTMGKASISLEAITRVMFGKLTHNPHMIEGMSGGIVAIVWDIRLPRILCGVFVGAGLAISGTIFQALLMNPLADPYTIGISTGAALGATIAIFLSAILQIATIAILPAAFIGALVTLFVVIKIAGNNQTLSSSSLIVAGIIVSSIGSAAISLIKSLSGDEVSLIVFWLMGSLASRTWEHVLVLAPVVVFGALICHRYARELNILSLGEESALSVGVEVKKVRMILLVTASLITAACVSASGIIGFVGLVVPHILRQSFTANHKYLMPLAGVCGAILLVLADNLTRVLLQVEIPVGVVTTLIGGPFFIYLFTSKAIKSII